MNLATQVLRSHHPVVVTFAASWCGPCNRMKPIMDEIEKDYFNADSPVKFVRVDITSEEGSTLAQHFGVRTVPFFGITEKGNILSVQPSSTTKEKMESWIKETIQ